MSSSTVRTPATDEARATLWELYKGWIGGLVIILCALVVGAGFWFHYHP
jgi:hypothetical protein